MHTTHPDEREPTKQLGLFGEPASSSARPEPANAPTSPTVDDIIQRALGHLNDVTKRTGAARFTSPTSAKARVQDGATAEDLLLVIDFCHAMWWGDPKMETFVRPKTLFGKENFPEYLVRARKWDEEGRPPLLGGAATEGTGDRRLEAYSAHVKGGRTDPGRADRG